MANIDIKSIEKKIYDYANSSKGQKKMVKTLKKYVNDNIETTDAGSMVITEKRMKEAANELVKYVVDAAYSAGVADSVLDDIATLRALPPKYKGGTTWEIQLCFESSLHRESLEPDKYGGVVNIIALFNNGYPKDAGRSEAISHIFGKWHDKYVYAKPYRESLQFMQWAINKFNMLYGSTYNAYVELDSVYEG